MYCYNLTFRVTRFLIRGENVLQDLISSIGNCDQINQDGNKLKKYFLSLAKKMQFNSRAEQVNLVYEILQSQLIMQNKNWKCIRVTFDFMLIFISKYLR